MFLKLVYTGFYFWEGGSGCASAYFRFSTGKKQAVGTTKGMVAETSYFFLYKGVKFLKKLWLCVGGEYCKIIWF